MKLVEGTFKNRRNQQIFTRSWLPETNIKAIVFLIHGYAEHSGRYAHVADFFTNEQCGVFGLDHHGHGKSEGRRADCLRFDDYIEDGKHFIDQVTAKYPQLPRFIFGHSMGGAIAIKCVLRFPQSFSGLLVTGCAIKISNNVSPFLQKLANLVAAVLPWLPVQSLDAAVISRNPQIVRNYDSDPLVYRGKVRARMGAQLLRASQEITANLEKITIPFWAGHGTSDKLIDPVGSQWLFDRAMSTDKTLRLFDGLYHEILNEPEKEVVLAEMVTWIQKQC
ncbi:MAG: alpha/beta hydrolase [bacterium]